MTIALILAAYTIAMIGWFCTKVYGESTGFGLKFWLGPLGILAILASLVLALIAGTMAGAQ